MMNRAGSMQSPSETSSSKWIRLAQPDVDDTEIEAIRAVLKSGYLTNGLWTEKFEVDFAARHDVGHAVAMANGTVALAAIYLALGVGPGDEVIVPSMTFVSSATSLLHVGAVPVFADVDAKTFNLDPSDVQDRITERTRGILAVHYGGQPADLDDLRDLAQRHGLFLIEDAAQAHGASYKGRPVGGLSDAAMFSFTPTKNITTGEGGIVTTNDPQLADRMRLLRNHGQEGPYLHTSVGYNWRMSELQAAMGVVQLSKLDAILERKRRNAEVMGNMLKDLPLDPPWAAPDREHVYMLYTLLIRGDRDGVLRRLHEQGVEAKVYFPPVHKQPIFDQQLQLPNTDRIAGKMLSIPFHSRLEEPQLRRIATALDVATRQ